MLVGAVLGTGCVPRATMCVATSECAAKASCVAGRCQPTGATLAIQVSRRLLLDPAAVAYLRPGGARVAGALLPPVFTLGRRDLGDAKLLLRFDVPLPPDAKVMEAYVLFLRAEGVDCDPSPIVLHAARIVEPWDASGISWASQPRVEETRSPATIVFPTSQTFVRVDVKDLVVRWMAHDVHDQGVAILADRPSATGVALAAGATSLPYGEGETWTSGGDPPGPMAASPKLELYVR